MDSLLAPCLTLIGIFLYLIFQKLKLKTKKKTKIIKLKRDLSWSKEWSLRQRELKGASYKRMVRNLLVCL